MKGENKVGSIKTLADLGENMMYEVRFPNPKRGEIYKVDLADMGVGTIHVQAKSRPGVIIQNDLGNFYSGTVLVALITSQIKKEYPMQYRFNLNGTESVIMFEQIITLDKNRLLEKLSDLTPLQLREAEEKLMYSLALSRYSLHNIRDLNVLNMTNTKTREGHIITYTIEMVFAGSEKLQTVVGLDKLKEFDSTINEYTDFDKLKKKLDNIKGLNWLVANNQI